MYAARSHVGINVFGTDHMHVGSKEQRHHSDLVLLNSCADRMREFDGRLAISKTDIEAEESGEPELDVSSQPEGRLGGHQFSCAEHRIRKLSSSDKTHRHWTPTQKRIFRFGYVS